MKPKPNQLPKKVRVSEWDKLYGDDWLTRYAVMYGNTTEEVLKRHWNKAK